MPQEGSPPLFNIGHNLLEELSPSSHIIIHPGLVIDLVSPAWSPAQTRLKLRVGGLQALAIVSLEAMKNMEDQCLFCIKKGQE